MIRFVAETCVDYFGDVRMVCLFDNDGQNKNEMFPCINMGFKYTNKLWRFHAFRSLRALFKRIKPDCICAFVSDVAVLTRFSTYGIPSVFLSAERGDPYIQNKIWKILTQIAYATSDGCFFQLESACKYYGNIIQKKSSIIPNPYLGKRYEPTSIFNRKKTIVSAGRFEKQKGYDTLLDVFSHVSLIHPEYSLIIYGDGSLKESYLEQVKTLGIIDKVFFPGYISDVAETIAEDGIFVLPSRFEGMPNALIEAMSTGIPTVSTNCSPGGPKYLTNDGKRGLLVEIDDKEKLFEAIEYLINNPVQAEQIGLRGMEIVDLLDKIEIQKKWIDAFDKYLKQRRIA